MTRDVNEPSVPTRQDDSVLHSLVHSAFGCVWHSQSQTRNEVERYTTELVEKVPLFLGGWTGTIASAATYALAEVKTNDSGSMKLLEALEGGIKGGLTQYSYAHFGAKNWGFITKGLTLGATSELLDVGLTPSNYYSKDGQLDMLGGIRHAIDNPGFLGGIGINVATLGLAPKLGGMFSSDLLAKNPYLATHLTNGLFGFTSGSLSELYTEYQKGGHIDPLSILTRGAAEGATTFVAGSVGMRVNHLADLAPASNSHQIEHEPGSQTRNRSKWFSQRPFPSMPISAFAMSVAGGPSVPEAASPIEPAARHDATILMSQVSQDASANHERSHSTDRNDPLPSERPAVETMALDSVSPGERHPELFAIDEGAKPFVSKIVEKYKTAAIDEDALRSIIESFPEHERPVAIKILKHGLPNSSETLFDAQMKSLRAKLETTLANDGYEDAQPFISTDHAGWGKAFGYLYRKLSRTEHRIDSIDPAQLPSSERVAILLDDPSTVHFTSEQVSALQNLETLYVLGPIGFEKGLNFFDYAQGAKKVDAKLHALVAEVQQLRTSDPAATDEQLIDRAIRGNAQANAAALNSNAVFIGTDDLLPGRSGDTGTQTTNTSTVGGIVSILNSSQATPERVEKFLRQYVPDNQQPVAYTLAAGGKHVTYPDMFNYIDNLEAQIESTKGPKVSSDKLLFHDADGNDSVDLVNYMYRIAKGIPREQFVTGSRLAEMAEAGQLADRGIVFLDDHIMTGDKIGKRFYEVRESANTSAAVYFATMLRDHDPIFGASGDPAVPYHVLSAERVKTFSPSTWTGATEDQLAKAHEYASDSGFVTGRYGDPRVDFMYPTISSNATITWPFAMPDNDVSVVRRFGHDVLGLRQTRDAEIRQLQPNFRKHVPAEYPREDPLRDLLAKGKLILDPSHSDYFRPKEATIADGTLQHKVMVQESRSTNVSPSEQAELSRLNQLLNLTPRYPAPVWRKEIIGGEPTDFIVFEKPEEEDLREGLLRLSGNSPDDDSVGPDRRIPAILKSDPEIRQAVERALVEKMIFAPDSHAKPLLGKTSDGRVFAFNQQLNMLDENNVQSRKPLWNGIDWTVSEEYEASELSDDTYNRLLSAYNKVTTGRETMGPTVRDRLEWFLEHRRFPGYSENNRIIH